METENGFIDWEDGGIERDFGVIDREDSLIGGTGQHRPSLADLRGQSLAKLLRDQGRALQLPRGGTHNYRPPGEKQI